MGVCLTTEGLNRLPSKEEFNFWAPSLLEEIHQVKPKVIAALSKVVFEKIGMSVAGARVVPLNHPRWYESHGAVSNKWFDVMVNEYRDALFA